MSHECIVSHEAKQHQVAIVVNVYIDQLSEEIASWGKVLEEMLPLLMQEPSQWQDL
jgi:hypothetical protein